MTHYMLLQRLLIARYAVKHDDMPFNAAAKIWIGRHAAQYRKWFNKHREW